MKAGWIRLALGASVSGVMAASAGVEFGTLTAESLKGPDAALAKLGVEPGDVRVSNDFVQLVIRAGEADARVVPFDARLVFFFVG